MDFRQTLISYYDNNNFNENYDNNKSFKKENKTKIIIVIILIILAFIIGIIFGKMLCSKYNRKIRANELEDNYSYISKNNNMKNINLQNTNFITNYQIIK